jgi:hypothetical protein
MKLKGYPMSYAAEVVADSSGKFCGNSLRFATRLEAEKYAAGLMSRWLLVTEWRVVESTDPVNRVIEDNTMKVVAGA